MAQLEHEVQGLPGAQLLGVQGVQRTYLQRHRGVALRVFVTEAVEEKLAAVSEKQQKPWVRLAGGLKHLHKETARINGILNDEFEEIEPEDWE